MPFAPDTILTFSGSNAMGYKCIEASKAMAIGAVTVSKAVSLARALPEIDNIPKQMLNS
jgi:hypothetical protein